MNELPLGFEKNDRALCAQTSASGTSHSHGLRTCTCYPKFTFQTGAVAPIVSLSHGERAGVRGTDCRWAIDYHRVKMHDKYDDVLAKFLLGRVEKKGGRR